MYITIDEAYRRGIDKQQHDESAVALSISNAEDYIYSKLRVTFEREPIVVIADGRGTDVLVLTSRTYDKPIIELTRCFIGGAEHDVDDYLVKKDRIVSKYSYFPIGNGNIVLHLVVGWEPIPPDIATATFRLAYLTLVGNPVPGPGSEGASRPLKSIKLSTLRVEWETSKLAPQPTSSGDSGDPYVDQIISEWRRNILMKVLT